jgi:predicted lipid carrier protein YhbT
MDMTLSPRERAERGRIMLAGNYIGPDRPVARDAETLGVVFDAIARSADPRGVASGTTVQWDFTDADPWYVALDNGSTRAEQGRAPKADVTLRMSLEDFGDIISGREDARRLMLTRRVRPRGNPRLLLKLPKVFA